MKSYKVTNANVVEYNEDSITFFLPIETVQSMIEQYTFYIQLNGNRRKVYADKQNGNRITLKKW